jgi:DNA-binding transcriptional LysR family regulator
MAMDWDKLRIFHMVAKAGSFTHAGESLNLSQSAVSRHISSFEEDLGIPLFHRHARGLILTEQGELLFQTSTDIFTKMMAIEGQLSDARNTTEGELSVTLPEFLGTSWLGSNIGNFHNKNPEIELTLLLDDRIFNLGLREADAAVRLYKPEQSELVQLHLTSINFVTCASKDYLASHGTPKTLDDLRHHTLIAYPDQALVPYKNPNALFEKAGIQIAKNKNLILLNSISTIRQAIRSGAGIGVLPRFMTKDMTDIVQLLPDTTIPAVDMYFVYPEDRRHSKRIEIFRDFLLNLVKGTDF